MNLKQLLGMCEHEYKIIYHNPICDEVGDKIGDKYHLQCKKCCVVKFIKS